MNKKRALFLISLGLIIPNFTSCSTPIFIDRLVVDGKDKIEIGETSTFKSEIYPAAKSSTKVNWSTSNPDIAYVDSKGNVTGLKEGKTTLNAKVGNTVVNQDIYIGGYVDCKVEAITSISTDSGITNIKEGDYCQLTPNFYPSNATNKDVIWTSDKPSRVSISKYGVIKGEYYNPNNPSDNIAKITATSKENKNISCSIDITVSPNSNKRVIKSFSEPSCLTHYKEKIKNSEDKIDESKIDRNNSQKYVNNKFFKYDDNEKDKEIYKVGIHGEFRFKCNITTSLESDPFKEIKDNNPFQKYQLLNEKGEDVSHDGYISESPYKGNEFWLLGDKALNKIFTLKVWPDEDKYDGVDSSMIAELTFKVVDGYNAYDFAGLTTIDNYSFETAHSIKPDHWIFAKHEFSDLWARYKREHNIPNGKDNKGLVGTILHNDIEITNDDFPNNDIIWSKKEAIDYVNGNRTKSTKESFDSFVEQKANIHQEEWKDLPDEVIRAKCFDMLNGSRKAYSSIFTRIPSLNYSLYGNYFSINCSKLKPAVYSENHSLYDYSKDRFLFNNLIGINIILSANHHDKKSICKEEVYDEYKPYTGSVFRSEHNVEIDNLNIIGNAVLGGTNDESIGAEVFACCSNSNVSFNNVISSNNSSSYIFLNEKHKHLYSNTIYKCKIFDNYSTFMKVDDDSTLNINDSIMLNTSGVGIAICESETGAKYSTIKLNNTYMENFVSGNEVFNYRHKLTLYLKMLGSIGYHAFNKYKNVKFGIDGKYAPKDPRNFIKVEDDVIKINFLVYHGFREFINVTKPGESSFYADNKIIFDLKEDGKEGSVIDTYNNIDMSSRVIGAVSFRSDNGGHCRIPLNVLTEADDLEMYNENINPSSILTSDHTMSLSSYCNNKNEVDNSIPQVPENFGKLFSGSYLTCFFKPLIGYMNAFVLGYK